MQTDTPTQDTKQPALPVSQVRRIQQTMADWTKRESDWLKEQINENHSPQVRKTNG